MDAFAGWIAMPIDLVKFASALDRPEASPVPGEQLIARMFERPEITGFGPEGHLHGVRLVRAEDSHRADDHLSPRTPERDVDATGPRPREMDWAAFAMPSPMPGSLP